jgi:hypothetical protein
MQERDRLTNIYIMQLYQPLAHRSGVGGKQMHAFSHIESHRYFSESKSRDSSVGIATSYGLDDQEVSDFESQ